MRRTLCGVAMAAMLAFVAGCTDEQQLENAVEDQQEAVTELHQEQAEAGADGIVTADEAEDIQEQAGDAAEATGEVAEQQGELIESETE